MPGCSQKLRTSPRSLVGFSCRQLERCGCSASGRPRWCAGAQGAPAARAEPLRALPLPMVQASLPLPECNPFPACASAQASDKHRGRGEGGTCVQRPAERGVVGAFLRTVGPRLHAARLWGLRAARMLCPRCGWLSRLPAGCKPRVGDHERGRALSPGAPSRPRLRAGSVRPEQVEKGSRRTVRRDDSNPRGQPAPALTCTC